MTLDYDEILDMLHGCHPDYPTERLPVAVVKQATLHKPSDPTVDGSAIYIGVEWRTWEIQGWAPAMDEDPEVREFNIAQAIAGTSDMIARGEI